MAEEGGSPAKKFNPKAIASGLFSGHKRIPSTSFYGYLFAAIAVDIVLSDWLPGSGTAFVMTCRGMYFIQQYKTDKMLATTVINAGLGFFPIIADFTNIAFVVVTYAINVAETSKAGASLAGQALSVKAAQLGNQYIATKAVQAAMGGGTVAAAGAVKDLAAPAAKTGGQSVGYGGKTAAAGGAAQAPTTAADKNIGYATDTSKKSGDEKKNVDGIQEPRHEPRDTGFRPTQPIFRKQQNEPETPASQNTSYANENAVDGIIPKGRNNERLQNPDDGSVGYAEAA
jgi:hypothetical protein